MPYILFLRIPLVSWKLPSPEINIIKSKSKGTLQKSVKDENSENGVATLGKDENLITDTWQTAVTAVSNIVRNVLFTSTFLDQTVKVSHSVGSLNIQSTHCVSQFHASCSTTDISIE